MDLTQPFGGGRRDEEKARGEGTQSFSFSVTPPRIAGIPREISARSCGTSTNAKKVPRSESIRGVPDLELEPSLISGNYIALENIDIVTRSNFSQDRPTVERDGMILVVDDDRFRAGRGRGTGGCVRCGSARWAAYPLTGRHGKAPATDMNLIIQEMLLATSSERQGRAIDKGQSASMERQEARKATF